MEMKNKQDTPYQKEGEEQLSVLIHQAGNDARIRRKKALDDHFKKIKRVVTEAESIKQNMKPA